MKATGSDTGNTTTWMLIENSPHQGVPLHKHLYEDESFFVVSGTFEITVGDKTITGGPGMYAYGSRNVPHQWTNMGSGRGQMLNVYTPRGIDKFFTAVGIHIHESNEQPQVDLAAYDARTKLFLEKRGIIRLGPSKFPSPYLAPDRCHYFVRLWPHAEIGMRLAKRYPSIASNHIRPRHG